MNPDPRIASAFRRAAVLVVASWLLLDGSAFAQSAPPTFQWTTITGRASIGAEDGPATSARFNNPTGLAFDPAGNLYVADTNNHTVRKISPAGTVSTLAGTPGQPGSADGVGAAARFKSPGGVAVDAAGNVYVVDTLNYTIRMITPAGVVTTIAGRPGQRGTADGNAALALFNNPQTIAVDGAGNVYVGDSGIRRISAGIVQTIFTSGTVTLTDGSSATVTTNGLVLAVDARRQVFFSGTVQSTQYSNGLFKLDAAGAVSAVLSTAAWASYPGGHLSQLATDISGNLMAVVDYSGLEGGEFEVWRITAAGVISDEFSVIHDGTGADSPAGGLAVSPTGETFYTRADNVVVKIAADGTQAILAGTPANPIRLYSLAVDSASNVWAGGVSGKSMYGRPLTAVGSLKVSPNGTVTNSFGSETYEATAQLPGEIAVDALDNIYFIGTLFWPPQAVQKLAPTGAITQIPVDRWFYGPGFVADQAGNLIVPETFGHVLWKRTPDNGWSVLAGQQGLSGTDDGIGGSARFASVGAITSDRSGNFYVLDDQYADGGRGYCVIRKVTSGGAVSTVSGNLLAKPGLERLINAYPLGLAVDSHGNFYLTCSYDHTVWRITAQGDATLVGGDAANSGSVDGLGGSARFEWPEAIAVDQQDNLYVADGATIRKGQLAGLPLITAQPQNQTVAPGTSVQFSVATSGIPAPTYQWYRNGAAIGGATGNSLGIPSAQTADAGQYTVVISNALGSVTSGAAVLTVNAVAAPPSGNGGGGGGGALDAGFGLLFALAAARLLAGKPTHSCTM